MSSGDPELAATSELAEARRRVQELESLLSQKESVPTAAPTPAVFPPLPPSQPSFQPPLPPPPPPPPATAAPPAPPAAVPLARQGEAAAAAAAVPPSPPPPRPVVEGGEACYSVVEDKDSDSESVSSFSSVDTSLGASVASDGHSDDEAAARPGEPGIRVPASRAAAGAASKSRSRSRSRSVFSRSLSSRRACELATVVPESEFLDMHRMDVDKVVGLHRHYDGASIPHYLTHVFDEGDVTAVDALSKLSAEAAAALTPFCSVTSFFTNRSKKKDAANLIRYSIYVGERVGRQIVDASTPVYRKDGTFIGKVACLFGPVETPSYIVQDALVTVEEDEDDECDMEPRCAVAEVLYTLLDQASVLYEEPEAPLSKAAAAAGDGGGGQRMTGGAVKALEKYHTKGCDASFLDDEELPVERQEFSDDEKEREAKAEKKKKRAAGGGGAGGIGLLDMLSDDDDASDDSSCRSQFEFNDDGEIVDVVRHSAAAKPRTARPQKRPMSEMMAPGGAAGRRAAVPPPPPVQGNPKKVFVFDIPLGVEWHQLAAIMGANFGTVEEALVGMNKKQGAKAEGAKKKFGFVTFAEAMAGKQVPIFLLFVLYSYSDSLLC